MDPEVREISLQKSTQVGATELLFCFVLYCLAVLKKSLLYVYPTKEKGKDVNTKRLVPAVELCEPTAELLSAGGATQHDLWLGGNLVQFAYTKSAASMRGDPFGIVLNDEVDVFDYSREDPIENGRSRQTTFDDSLMINVSTPMDDQSGITAMYETANVRWTYQTPCSKCGGFFELWEFSLIQWIGGMQVDGATAAANCYLRCPCCEERVNLDDHRWMVQHGIWITQNETIESDGTIIETLDEQTRELTDKVIQGAQMLSRIGSDAFRRVEDDGEQDGENEDDAYGEESHRYGVRIVGQRNRGQRHGYRICTMQSLVSAKGISGIVQDFVEAGGNPEATWWRDRMGRSPNTKGERIEISDIKLLCKGPENQGHHFGRCPPWTIALFGGIDCQKSCVKLAVYAFGAEGKRRALVYSKEIERDESLKFVDVRDQLADIGNFEVDHARRKLTPRFFIDSGAWTHEVYQITRELHRSQGVERFILCKGDSHAISSFKPYRRSGINEVKGPSGEKYELPHEIELIMVNGNYFKDQRMKDLMPLSEESVENLRAVCENDEQFESALDMIHPFEFPSIESWPDADAFIAELAAEEKVWVGAGSGRTGKDAMGRLRREWRKRSSTAKNDYGDATDYACCAADRFGIYEWTHDMAREEIAKIESTLGNAAYESPHSGISVKHQPQRTLAGDAAINRII